MQAFRICIIAALACLSVGAAATTQRAGPAKGAKPIEVVQSYHENIKQKRVAEAFDLHWDVGMFLEKVFDDAYKNLSKEDQEKARQLYTEYYRTVMGSDAIAEMMASAGYSNYKEVSTGLPGLTTVSFHFKSEGSTDLNKLILEKSGKQWRIVDQQADGPPLSRSARSKWFQREHNVTVLEYLQNQVNEAKEAAGQG